MALVDWLGLLVAGLTGFGGLAAYLKISLKDSIAEERMRNATLFAPLIDHIELKSEIRALNKSIHELTKHLEKLGV
jgi:hypothetical protein